MPWVTTGSIAVLLMRARSGVCALPLTDLLETMRPLPARPAPEAPAFLHGVAVIRGEPVPVVDLDCLLGAPVPAEAGRYVLVRVGARRVALAVESVLGIREIDRATLAAKPPLLGSAPSEVIAAMGALDRDLLVLLDGARLLPPEASEAAVAAAVPA